MYTHVHSSTTHESQKVETAQMPSMDERLNHMWSIYIVEYYSAIKRNEILIRATVWMNLKNIMLSQRRQI